MLVNVKALTRMDIDITTEEAFQFLLKALSMEFVMYEHIWFTVRKCEQFEERHVYCGDELYDDRGDLFVALRNVAVQLYPNMSFRNADYIYDKE